MRICVLHPSYQGSGSAFQSFDPECDLTALLAGHQVEQARLTRPLAVRQVRQLVGQGFDVFVNLCDGARDEDRAGAEVVEALERLGAAFTGAGSAFYEPSRAAVRLAAYYAGVAMPRSALVAGPDDLAAAAGLSFPLFVKHPSSYGSIGLNRRSRIEDPAALAAEVARMAGEFGGALVEEYVAGREFTVLVGEGRGEDDPPLALAPAEFRFPPGESFKHFELKWVHLEAGMWQPVDDPDLALRLREAGRLAFAGLQGSGYARCDLRLDEQGRLFLLDVNPNCGIFYPPGQEGGADAVLALDPLGPKGFLEHLLACAVRRRERAAPRLAPPGDRSGAPRAARDVAAGEVLASFEQRGLKLVSRGHVERAWSEVRQRWFRGHSHPLGDDLYVLWESVWEGQPASWPSLPHSCDPGALVQGLTLVARRRLARGEPVTVDHATFRAGAMDDFDCACGAARCRGTVRASDHLLPDLEARYGEGALSDYVRARRRELGLVRVDG